MKQEFEVPLHEFVFAIENKEIARAKRVLEENPGLNERVRSVTSSLLSTAADNHDLEMMRFLVDNGAPLNTRFCDPFAETAGAGFVEGVTLMLDRGAILNEESNGETICLALRYAASKGHLDVCGCLFQGER